MAERALPEPEGGLIRHRQGAAPARGRAPVRAQVVNDADDFVILCREGMGEEALVTMRRLMSRLGLMVNEKKTRWVSAADPRRPRHLTGDRGRGWPRIRRRTKERRCREVRRSAQVSALTSLPRK